MAYSTPEEKASMIYHANYGYLIPNGDSWLANTWNGQAITEQDVRFGGFYTLNYRAYVALPLREVMLGREPNISEY